MSIEHNIKRKEIKITGTVVEHRRIDVEDRHRCLQAGSGDKRTGFLQCSGIAISPLPSLRPPAPRSFSTDVLPVWLSWHGRATNLEHQVSANEPCKRVSPCTCSLCTYVYTDKNGTQYRVRTEVHIKHTYIYIYILCTHTYIYMYIYIYTGQ